MTLKSSLVPTLQFRNGGTKRLRSRASRLIAELSHFKMMCTIAYIKELCERAPMNASQIQDLSRGPFLLTLEFLII